MRTLSHELGTIYVPGRDDDLDDLFRLHNVAEWWAADTETTGLGQFREDYRVRIVQCGTRDEAWILRPDWHRDVIRNLVTSRPTWWQNWVFDAISMEQSPNLSINFDQTAAVAHDTEILGRLLDPRPVQFGGHGHKLEQMSQHYLGTESKKDSRTALYEAWARPNKIKIDDMWPLIPIDLEEYLLYAGQDVFLTARLAENMSAKVNARGNLRTFYEFERPLSRRLSTMQRVGIRFDHEWADKAEGEYLDEFLTAEGELENRWQVNRGDAQHFHTAKAGIQARLETMGVKWTKHSDKTGKPSLDKDVLKVLTGRRGDIGELAGAVTRARVNKHYAGYIEGMRAGLGKDGRVHPNVRPMQAATHRMSISNPPMQQFPRGDNRPRGCLLADEGDVILSCDFAQVEYRIGAAISRDPVMILNVTEGRDPYATAAAALFGPEFTKDQRQVSKPIVLGRLYLGGAKGIRQQMLESDTTGQVPSLSKVQKAIKHQDTETKVYQRWANRLKSRVENDNGRLTTATGRSLLVSPAYAAPNYTIQSTARDIFAAGINALHKQGLGDMIRLVVHDEVVMSVPRDEAEEIGRIVDEAMSTVFKGVPIDTEWEVKGERWSK